MADERDAKALNQLKSAGRKTNVLKPQDFVFNEEPIGNKDGINNAFTLKNEPIPGTVQVFKRGMILADHDHYSIDYVTKTIYFMPNLIPVDNERLVCHYIYFSETDK